MNATQRTTYPEEAGTPDHGDPVLSVVGLARRALSGRFRLAVPLALGLAVVGGIMGHSLSPPKYSSTGLLRVAPTLPKLLYSNEQNQVPPAYMSMVSAHATLLGRADFLEQVIGGLDSTAWEQWGAVDSTGELIGNFEVNHRRGDEVVTIRATGRNPAQVQAAVNAVLRTHLQEQTSLTTNSLAEIDSQLAARARELEAEADGLQQEIVRVAGPYGGVETLEWLHETRRAELEEVGERLIALGAPIDGAGVSQSAEPAGEREETEDASGRVAPIHAMQARLAELQNERVRLEGEIKLLSKSYGPKHRSMRELAGRLESVTDLANEYQARVNERSRAVAMEIAELRERHAELSAEAGDLGRVVLEVSSLREQRGRRLTRLEEANSRREELQVETDRAQTTRASIAARGEFPTTPSSDRRGAAASAGALLGIVVGLGIVVVYGAFDRRCRSTADAMALTPDLPLLGVLPELKPRNSWLHQQAASGIHQIRNVLQIGGVEESIKTYCLTSSGPNEGKTSIAMALAVSFAQSGQKALVIDADLHGRGATRDLQMSDRRGLRDAVAAGDPLGCVHAGPVRGLWVIPAGQRNALMPERISAAALGQLLRTVRDRYDAIIIDTAPLLGGPEAATICALADAVVLTVSRNCDGKLVNAAQLRLRQVGARYVGLVFNRATESDFQRSGSCDQYIPHRSDERDRAAVAEAVESLRDTLMSAHEQHMTGERAA